MRLHIASLFLALPFLGSCSSTPAVPNTLTDGEQAAGWQLLFDGESLDHWRTFRQQDVSSGWMVVDGTISRVAAGGDLITREQYESFVLDLEWMISPKGNSGIFFHVTEDRGNTWETGPEMQILDDDAFGDALDPRTASGSNYALHAPAKNVARAAGEWNHARIEVRNGHVTQWLNGHQLLEYTLRSPEWQELVNDSKFASMPDYGLQKHGHIALQDHGNPVWFRNVKILPLD